MLHKNKTIFVLGLLLLILILSACADEPAQEPPPVEDAAAEAPAEEAPAEEAPAEEAPAEEAPAEETEPIHWSYEGEGGPEYWGSLEPEYAACSEGMEQSPVNILCDAPINPDDVAFAYAETAVNIVNNGHAIQVNYDEGSTAVIDGSEYALQQFHFHSLSEHTIGGENAAMEMHLVHTDADGNNAVIGVMLVEGAENPAFDPVWDNMPAEEGDPVTIEGAYVNVDDLLPADRSYYAYEGSLTTPPCTEGVHWHVLSEPVEISAEQIDAFRAIHDGTNRPIQPRNDREFIAKEAKETAHWSYEGETGPEFWGSLDPAYAACSEGMEQSPVDITADAPVNPDDVAYAYEETAVNIVNNGHAIQVNYDEGSTAEIDGTTYDLKQFHFHSLSEHTLAGANTDMEMHLVHADADGNNAVISVMLVEGAENPAFDPVWDNMPAEEGDPVTIEGAFVNVDDLLPEDRSYYHYMGSLTTPACTEGVNWHVLATPVELSAEQIAAFREIHDGTNRPVQPMNEREFMGPEEAEEAHWSYEGETGPEYWGSLKPEYAACGEGLEQSPVNITTDAPFNPDDVVYAYGETAVNIVNNGHAIQVNYDEGSTAEIDGTTYDLKQFHFHSPSEHTYNGVNAAMEMHLVHADADGNNAVIGVLIIEGPEENEAYAPVWDNMPAEEGDPVTIEGVFVNVDDLLPANRDYVHYAGSLTTPPCTEGVNWHILAEPVLLSAEQIAQFRAIHDSTNRPVQPMNERVFMGPEEGTGEAEEIHWSYEGETAPEYWGSLSPDYAACGLGMEQSPVDIMADAPVNPDDVAYAYAETAVNIVNNGHAIQVNYDEGSTADIDGTTYDLKQFHFHSLSEHQLGGANTDMEMHLVHADANGNNAVVSVMLVEGAENPAFAPVWNNMPAEEGDPVTVEGAFVNVDDLLPEERSYYHYMGSLTTPACTEGVNWHVLATPVELSAAQIAAFREIHDGTNRPVQPMNDRVFMGPEEEATDEGEAAEVHWSYVGETGPEYWGSLKPEYAACGEGVEQSPVNITPDAPVNPDDVIYSYAETSVNIENNGHAIQVNYNDGSTAVIDGTEYALKQFHFHSLSEHTVGGTNGAMEMHLVHADANGNNAVVGVLLVEGAENPAFAPVWDNMPAEAGEPYTVEGAFVNVTDLLPEDLSYYRYDGSLTTPPCTEGVLWHVLSNPVALSAEQIAQFRAIHDGTNRPVQPMNDRSFY